ncbi:MAG: 4Fe-4S dicluster domain-containing protein [Bacillota bacterium]|nr:4Fe-4S dicluster domain-containing protein [Bacillota bacterium]
MEESAVCAHYEADARECTGCRYCEAACGLEHFGKVAPALARVRVRRYDDGRDEVIMCRNCPDHPCVAACPTEALTVQEGHVHLEPDLCIACAACQEACPHGAVFLHPAQGYPLICVQCGTCARFCPAGVMRLVSAEASAGGSRKRWSSDL